jgi:hypothetical protein
MQFRPGGAPWIGACFAVLALSANARADQFIVTDVTYTHSGQTTSDSHYRVAPSAATPKDWTKPLDWSKGSVHVLLEVKTKPGETPTKFQICFEGSPTYACTDQSPTYTKPGKYEWSTPFAKFYQASQMKWANGVSKVALILKDTNNGKPQGDPKYVPTDLHVEVAVVSEGSTYQASSKDAGVADASVKDANVEDSTVQDARADEDPSDAGEVEETIRDSGTRPLDASTPRRDASTATGADAGETEEDSAPATASQDDGCALGGTGGQQGWLALLALAFMRRRRAVR